MSLCLSVGFQTNQMFNKGINYLSNDNNSSQHYLVAFICVCFIAKQFVNDTFVLIVKILKKIQLIL